MTRTAHTLAEHADIGDRGECIYLHDEGPQGVKILGGKVPSRVQVGGRCDYLYSCNISSTCKARVRKTCKHKNKKEKRETTKEKAKY